MTVPVAGLSPAWLAAVRGAKSLVCISWRRGVGRQVHEVGSTGLVTWGAGQVMGALLQLMEVLLHVLEVHMLLGLPAPCECQRQLSQGPKLLSRRALAQY